MIRIALLLFLSLSFILPKNSYAWGHEQYLSPVWINAKLINAVIQKNSILYCIDVNDTNFDKDDLGVQMGFAIRLWLKPLEELGVTNTSILLSNCSENKFNLKLVVGPDSFYPQYPSEETVVNENNHYFALIKINTTYHGPYIRYNGKSFPYVDFSKLLPAGSKLLDMLSEISILNPSTPPKLAEKLGLDSTTVFNSSYRVILHELGHAFGLCDLYPSQVGYCDPDFMNPGMDQKQPDAIMNNSDFFYLTPDDTAGIKSLLSRFSKKQ